jgi:nicotinic acid phosphoribosyltransferase
MTNRFAPIEALTDTDAYKLDHRRQYPVGTTGVLSNFTNRGSRIERVTHVVNFGLQKFLAGWLGEAFKPFFAATEDEVAALYEEFTTFVLGPNEIGSDHIRALHRLGYVPLKFRSLPEGALVPLRVPSFTVENTLPEFFWLTNYIETVMSSEVWQPSTSATTAYYFRKLLDEWAIKTTGSKAGVEWQGHDFSFRGMPGREAAAASGAGHNLSFYGSDNLNVINFVNSYYSDKQVAGYSKDDEGNEEAIYFDSKPNGLILGSVPATEHSVMTAGGSDEGDEQKTFEHVLGLYKTGIVSQVSDTWDLWNVLTDILPAIKDKIMARDGKLVIRPDSGDPVDILTGTVHISTRDFGNSLNNQYQHSEVVASVKKFQGGYLTPPQKGVIELLWDIFGGTVNEQGYKVLDPHIGAIYGDSITYERAEAIFERLEAKGFASTNIVLGIGSFTYQYVTRDTFQSAIKATHVTINGVGKAIFKDPKTDSGMKKSAKGRLAVVWADNDYKLVDDTEAGKSEYIGSVLEGTGLDMLQTVWEDGEFVKYYSYAEVRENLHPEGIA